jgi:hypothetical protein
MTYGASRHFFQVRPHLKRAATIPSAQAVSEQDYDDAVAATLEDQAESPPPWLHVINCFN